MLARPDIRRKGNTMTMALTKENFETTIKKEGIVLIDWWAEWCGPCKRFAPTFEAASARHPDVTFGKIDTEDQQELVKRFKALVKERTGKVFPNDPWDQLRGAAGAVLHYLTQQLRRDVTHLARLGFYQVSDYLVLDAISLRNLEILEPLHRDAPRNTTLFGALNRTVTPMGARRLRDWLTQPLAATGPIVIQGDHGPVAYRKIEIKPSAAR